MGDFFFRAIVGGVGAALAAGPVGCFVVWRGMAYFGAALAHAVLLGIVIGFLLEVEPVFTIFGVCLLLAGCLVLLERQRFVPVDALLGVLAHAVFAAGLVAVAFMEQLRINLIGYLFGDILSVSVLDIWLVFGTAILVTAALSWQWRNLLLAIVAEDLAVVEGVPVERMRLLLVFLLTAVVAVGMKIVGMLLVVSLLIIPAATARRLAATPEQMAVAAAGTGILSTVGGLFASLEWDIPAGPAIVLVASALFAVSLLLPVRGVSERSGQSASKNDRALANPHAGNSPPPAPGEIPGETEAGNQLPVSGSERASPEAPDHQRNESQPAGPLEDDQRR